MKRNIVALIATLAGSAGIASPDVLPKMPTGTPGPDATRVEAISQHLPERPCWAEAYTPLDQGRARAFLKMAIPDCPDELYLRFKRDGNRTAYQNVYNKRIEMLVQLAAMAAQKDGGAECLAKTEKLLRAICAERSWVLPAHDRNLGNFNGTALTIDLGSSRRAYKLAEVVARLGEKLSPEVRSLAVSEIERRVFALYRATNRDSKGPVDLHGNSWFYVRSNWNAVCHANVVRAALAIVDDRMDRAAFVEAAERGMRYFLESFLDDGYCTEGGGYWNYGFGHYLNLSLAVRNATGGFVDFTRMPRARKAMEYGFGYRLADGICPVFSDGGASAPSPDLLKIGEKLWPDMKGLAAGGMPPRTIFPVAQVYIMRSKRFAFGVKGGNNAELHNHNDVGSWTLVLDGVEMAGDPGGEIYTARTFSPRRYESDVINSYGHPVPLVDGVRQGKGAEYAATVLMSTFNDSLDTVMYDIRKAYPATSSGLRSLVRTISFDRAAECVTVRDAFSFETPGAFESVIVTYAKAERAADGRGVLLTRAPSREIARPQARMKVSIETEGGDWEIDEKTIENPGRQPPLRIAVRFRAPVKEGVVTWRFSPGEQVSR